MSEPGEAVAGRRGGNQAPRFAGHDKRDQQCQGAHVTEKMAATVETALMLLDIAAIETGERRTVRAGRYIRHGSVLNLNAMKLQLTDRLVNGRRDLHGRSTQ